MGIAVDMSVSSGNKAMRRKVKWAVSIGTAIEWYNFFLYITAWGYLSAAFFPKGDKATTEMYQWLATNAVAFVARPFGGVICGHIGDRKGRKFMLVYTLLISGIATFLIGVLPEYTTINIWAPIMLVVLRFAQGFAIGGEWGGAVLMAAEHAPKESRGYDASLPQLGVPVGLFLSSVVFLPIPPPQEGQPLGLMWRVPFLLSIALVAVGVFIRRSIVDSRVFIELTEKSKVPLLDAFRRHRREALLAIGAKIGENGVFYFYTTFALLLASKYTTYTDAPLPRNTLFFATMLAAVLLIPAILAFATLSDHVGRRRVYLAGAIFAGLFAFPSFWMIKTAQSPLVIVAVVCALALGWAAMYAPQASFFPELFGTGVRYSGASLGGQFATIFAGGLGPLIALRLVEWAGHVWPAALLLVVMATVTAVSVYLAPETYRRDLSDGAVS